MKLPHLDVFALAQVLGHEPITTLAVIPDLSLELINEMSDQAIVLLDSSDIDDDQIESLLAEIDAATMIYDSYRNLCTRDQLDEMIRLGLVDPQDVEDIDLVAAEAGDVYKWYGLTVDIQYYVFCAHSFDNVEVVIRPGIGSVQSDTDIVRQFLAAGRRDKAVAFLDDIIQH